MKKNNSFRVPESEEHEFDLLVQRANRRIKSSLKYIQQQDIKSEKVQRAMLGDYAHQENWHTKTTVFSRSKRFESEKDYQQYKRHVLQWGDENKNHRSEDALKEGYYKAIINALTTTAIDNANGVLTPRGRLPGDLARKIKNLSLEQMTHFFDDDPTETITNAGWSSDDYIGVDEEEFVNITVAHLKALRKLYPKKRVKSTKKQSKKGKAKKAQRGRKGKAKKAKRKKK